MIDPKDLSSLIEGDVDASPAALETASHDASIFEVKPQVVVYPKNAEDIKKLVKYANEHQGDKITLTARSGGTDMSGGPLTESIVVNFTKYFDRIERVEDGYAVTQPGVYYRDFDKATKAKGDQIMPSYPASREICTVGGMVSNNSGGEKTLTYGKTEKYIRRLKMVCSDGNEYEFKPLSAGELAEKKKLTTFEGDIYRGMSGLIDANKELLQKAKPVVSKNSAGYYLWNVVAGAAGFSKVRGLSERSVSEASSAGLEKVPAAPVFDLTKMIVGSQGTLGMVTEIEFALVKPKKYSRLLVIFLKDLDHLAEIANHVLQFKPESFESYDDHTFKVAVKFLPALIKQMKGNIISLGLSFLPEMWAVLMGGVPKFVMMAEFTADTPAEAIMQAEKARLSLAEFHVHSKVTETAADAEKYWTIRRESFNMLRQHVHELRTAPFIDDFVVLPEKLPQFLPRLYKILDQYKSELTYTIAGHVGDGNFHIIPLMNLHQERAHRIIEDLSVQVYTLIHEFGGSITGEHNDGLIRTPFLKMQYGDAVYKLFEETKKIWDPKGIFNPGKKVGGTLQYAFKHILK